MTRAPPTHAIPALAAARHGVTKRAARSRDRAALRRLRQTRRPDRSRRASVGYFNALVLVHVVPPEIELLGLKQMDVPSELSETPVPANRGVRVSVSTLPLVTCAAKFWLLSTTVSRRLAPLLVPLMLTPPVSGAELSVPFWKMCELVTIRLALAVVLAMLMPFWVKWW